VPATEDHDPWQAFADTGNIPLYTADARVDRGWMTLQCYRRDWYANFLLIPADVRHTSTNPLTLAFGSFHQAFLAGLHIMGDEAEELGFVAVNHLCDDAGKLEALMLNSCWRDAAERASRGWE
jgi:hypothetical protein